MDLSKFCQPFSEQNSLTPYIDKLLATSDITFASLGFAILLDGLENLLSSIFARHQKHPLIDEG